MERMSPAVVRFPLAELHPGPIDLPELAAAGVHLEVLAADNIPPIGVDPDPSVYARSLATDLSEVILGLRATRSGLRLYLLDHNDRRLYSDRWELGDVSHWYWTRAVGDPHALVIEIPATFVSIHRAATGGRPPAPRLEPDWDAAETSLRRFDPEVAAGLRERLRQRQAAWPSEPAAPGGRRDQGADLTWGAQAVGDVLADIAATGLARPVDAFVPAVRMVPLAGMGYDQVPIGASHLHGCPHVPLGFEWPTWDCPGDVPEPRDPSSSTTEPPGGTGPLTFVAQVDLAEAPLPASWPGPREGWLLLFLDFDRLDRQTPRSLSYTPGAHRVLYLAAGVELHLAVPPWRHPVYGRTGWLSAEPDDGVRYLGYGRQAWVMFEPLQVVAAEPLRQAYLDCDAPLPDGLGDWLSDAVRRASRPDWHWLGGEPNPCQDDPLGEALANGLGITGGDALRSERPGWLQLVQLASDDETDTMWGDAGLLHVFIRTDDLRRSRFDRTLLTFQCS